MHKVGLRVLTLSLSVLPVLLDQTGGFAQLANSSWPTFRGDAALSGLAKVSFPDTIYYISTVDVGGTELFTPVVTTDSLIVLVSKNGRIFRYDPLSQGLIGDSMRLAGRVSAHPVMGENQIMFVSTDDNYFYAIKVDKTDLTVIDSLELDGLVDRPANISSNGTIYVVDANRKVYAFTADRDGRFAGNPGDTTIIKQATSAPIVKNDRLLIALEDKPKKIRSLRYEGNKWDIKRLANFDPDIFDPKFVWLAGHPTPGHDRFWAGSNMPPFVVECEDPRSDDDCRRLDVSIDGGTHKLPVVFGNSLVIAQKEDAVLIEVASGEILFRKNGYEIVKDPVVDSKGIIFVVIQEKNSNQDSQRRSLYAIDTRSEDSLLVHEGQNIFENSNPPAFGPLGRLYIPGDGRMFVVEPPRPAELVSRGNQLVGCILEPDTVIAMVRDQGGKPYRKGHPVTFRVENGSGHFSPGKTDSVTIDTDSTGRARVLWVLGPETAIQTIRISAPDLDTLSVSVSPKWPVIAATHSALDFGQVPVGDDSTMEYTVHNRSRDCTLLITGVQPLDGNMESFRFEPFDSIKVAQGDSASLRVNFKPQKVDSLIARFRIASTDPDTNRLLVQLSGTGIDTEAPVITHTPVKVAAWHKSLQLSVSARDSQSSVDSLLVYCRLSGSGKYDSLGTTDGGYQRLFPTGCDSLFINCDFEIPAGNVTEKGIEYYVEAYDSEGHSSRRPFPDTLFYSTQVIVPEDCLAVVVAPNLFKMISVPLETGQLPVNSAFGKIHSLMQEKKAFVWRFDPTLGEAPPDSPYVAVSVEDTARIKQSQSWLVYSMESTQLDNPAGASIRTDEPFSIELQPGWNAFSIPFGFEIPLANISPSDYCTQICFLRANSTKDNAGWESALAAENFRFKPWQGYVVQNSAETVRTMSIIPSSTAVREGCEINPEEVANWLLRIDLTEGSAFDQTNCVGVIPDAEEEWDKYELVEPPLLRHAISLYFEQNAWASKRGKYTTDFRPRRDEGYVWQFKVLGRKAGGTLRLTFRNLEQLPPTLTLTLLDLDLKHVHDPRKAPEYLFRSEGARRPRSFKLFVGQRDFVAGETEEFSTIPETIELLGNFPNPFNPTTSIKFGLPEAMRVSLFIYNINGKLVKRLLHMLNQGAGYHIAVWDGRNERGRIVSSGVYVYQLRTDELVLSRKLVFAK